MIKGGLLVTIYMYCGTSYTLKVTCNTIHVAECIKQHVFYNRVYKPPKPPSVIKKITIKNTQINNIFNKIDLAQKISLLDLKNTIPCSDKVAFLTQHESNIYANETPGLVLDDNHFELLVGKMCRSHKSDLSDMNVLVDFKADRMMIYDDDKWFDQDLSSGVKMLMACVHDNFMNEHERYLIKCYKSTIHLREKQDIREQILHYYIIISAFDLMPYVFNRCDDDILDNQSRAHHCEDELYPMYKQIKKKLLISKKKSLYSNILKAIKSNSKITNMFLNERLFTLSQSDSEAFAHLLGK